MGDDVFNGVYSVFIMVNIWLSDEDMVGGVFWWKDFICGYMWGYGSGCWKGGGFVVI